MDAEGGGRSDLRKTFYLASVLILLLFCSPVSAEVILDDVFNDTSQVDLAKTSARVDVVDHSVLLPWRSLTSSVSALENGIGYAVASQDGVTLYEYDDASHTMLPNTVYSCPWATDATGVSIRQDNLNIWAVSGDSIAYYRYNGAGMTNDPALKISGLNDVLSVSAFKSSDSALMLQNVGNKAKITKYNAVANLNPALVFEPDITDPVGVSMVDSSPDFRLFTKTTAYYFSYDEAGGTYIEDPAKKITGLVDIISAGSDETGSTVLTGTDMGYYMNSDTGGAARVDVYSPGPVSIPVAVSLKAGAYEQVLFDENGNVQWWTYDDGAGRMVRDASLEVRGLSLNKGYASPGSYFSKAFNTAVSYDAARLTVTENIPVGTTISYSVSSDGGTSFTAVTPGTWTSVPRGNSFVARAVLSTSDPQKTPKILHVTLEVDEDLVLEGQITPYPAERGRNVTIQARAVSLTTGAVVDLDSCSVTYPLETKVNGDQALPGGQLPTSASMLYKPASGYWGHTFLVPGKTIEGRWPDDGVYRVRITGMKGPAQKETELNLEIAGHILRRLIVRTVSW